MSELAKVKHLVEPYCNGCGLDVGSQGHSVIPHAWQLDLEPKEFKRYNGGNPPAGPIQLRGDARKLPVETGSLDFLISSHLLEDYLKWTPILVEWVRVLKPGGRLIILVPDHKRFRAAVAAGQPDNSNHHHEAYVGELSSYAALLGVRVIEDRLVDEGYTILFVAERL
jgi:SAM-dependent methyltransferase